MEKNIVEYIAATGHSPSINIADLLDMMEPKLDRKVFLENEIIELEKKLGDQLILEERSIEEEALAKEKEKLDKALKMNVLSQEEYSERLFKAQKKSGSFY